MFNVSISHGPVGTVWALLFKTEEKASEPYIAFVDHGLNRADVGVLIGTDDFGQSYAIPFSEIHAVLVESLDQIEQARIQRALADERVKAKFMVAAKSDPVIRQAIQGQQAPIMTPFGRG